MLTTKRDINELRRRMTKKDCTFTRMSGCYVDGNKTVLLKFNQFFPDLPEEEFFKYLDIAKKSLSGSLAGNLLELRFQKGETATECQRFLYALKASGLKNEELTDRLYEQIIETYEASGNYLILLFHDIYDVPVKTTDRKKVGESSESFEYIIAAICPVDMSKPGLRYNEDAGKIGVSERFWMVGAPEIAFTYPAFVERSADASAVLYYVKTGKDSHREVIENLLCCDAQRTAGEEKSAFREVVEGVFEDPQQGESVFLRVQKELSDRTMPDPGVPEEEVPQLTLTRAVMEEVISAVDMPEEARDIMQEAFQDAFGDLPPQAQNVLDKKLVEESTQRLRTLELETEVTGLKEELSVQSQALTEAQTAAREAQASLKAASAELDADADIILRVHPGKAKGVHARMISGSKYLLVPLDQGDATQINGVDFDF